MSQVWCQIKINILFSVYTQENEIMFAASFDKLEPFPLRRDILEQGLKKLMYLTLIYISFALCSLASRLLIILKCLHTLELISSSSTAFTHLAYIIWYTNSVSIIQNSGEIQYYSIKIKITTPKICDISFITHTSPDFGGGFLVAVREKNFWRQNSVNNPSRTWLGPDCFFHPSVTTHI